jgi:hypothetical protein
MLFGAASGGPRSGGAACQDKEEDVATARITAGICGFTTTVRTSSEGPVVKVDIESDCEHIKKLAAALTEVDPYREITFRGAGPLTYELAREHCAHAACPVPTGILKAIEVDAGLALPKDVTITVTKE